MESKQKFWKGVLVGFLVTAFVGLIIVGIAAGILMFSNKMYSRPELAKGVESQLVEGEILEDTLDIPAIQKKMNTIQHLISENYLFDEDLEKVEDGIYKGIMYGLGDPYSVYYNAEQYTSLLEETEGIYGGIGALVTQDRNTGIIEIMKVFEGSPALEAGLLPGDILYLVADEEVTGQDLDLLVRNSIRGPEGSKVKVTVIRGVNNDKIELEIERRQIIVPTVESRMMDNKIGYVAVSQFDVVTSGQFIRAIEELEEQGMEKLVIDLRDNPGGILDAAVEMMAYVLPDGMLIYTEDKNGNGEQYFSKDGKIHCTTDIGKPPSNYPKKDDHELDIPIALLVNGNSASASEVFAGAMKDYNKAVIVGTTTYGKGIVQQLFPLGDKTGIKMTTSHYFTPKGSDVHEKGITPDIEVEVDEELKGKAIIDPEEDNQLQAAIEALE